MSEKELLEKLEEARSKGLKIGLVQGSWDLFHLGHLKYIQKAKSLCDFLIVAMDSDEKIKKRKGNSRPIIPQDERYEFISLLNICDYVFIKGVNEPKWGLIKTVRPDVLVAIKENYSDEDLVKLKEYCGEVAVLPRQSQSSTSDKIRKIMISGQKNRVENLENRVLSAIENIKERINYSDDMPEPIPQMIKNLKDSTDWVMPVSAAYNYNGKWYLGANHSDFNIPKEDVDSRSELYYATTEHAEINLLKKLENVEQLDGVFWCTLFPCDKCMKVLIDKGIKEIKYLEDHPNRNWSKRSHALADKKGVKTTCVLGQSRTMEEEKQIEKGYIFQTPDFITQSKFDGQKVILSTFNWYVFENDKPKENLEKQFIIVCRSPIFKIEDMNREMWDELQGIWIHIVQKYQIPSGALYFEFAKPSISKSSPVRLHAHLVMLKNIEKTNDNNNSKKLILESSKKEN